MPPTTPPFFQKQLPLPESTEVIQSNLLPAPIADRPFPIPQHPIDDDTPYTKVLRHDLQVAAHVFYGLADGWSQAKTIDDICKMSVMSFKAVKDRRDILGLPYAHQDSSKNKEYLVYPAD